MRTSDADTIVAIATAPGEAAIGIVRLSGPDAIPIACRCFRGRARLDRVAGRRLTYGRFVNRDQDLDEVLVSVMRGPRSFTGEDTVEFNCHGGPHLLRRAVEALLACGARLAERGEFTRRAFLNGRLDLTQAEAVADLISARADLGLQSAFFQLRGGLRNRFEAMAEDLRQALTFLEAGLDFSEDVEIDPESIRPALDRAAGEVGRLLDSYRMGRVLREGALVTIAGPPNAGKSSLLNRLLEEDRAIVTPIPGTTRDTIEESVDLDGLRVTLVDTAGIRQAGDPVEREGARRSRRSIAQARLVLLVVDAALPPGGEALGLLEEVGGREAILILNKRDLGIHPGWASLSQGRASAAISALTGEGVDVLRASIRCALLGNGGADTGIVTRERHADALRRAGGALRRARRSLDEARPGELIALELREALDALAEIVGQTTSDDILDRIFKTFCIGK